MVFEVEPRSQCRPVPRLGSSVSSVDRGLRPGEAPDKASQKMELWLFVAVSCTTHRRSAGGWCTSSHTVFADGRGRTHARYQQWVVHENGPGGDPSAKLCLLQEVWLEAQDES